MKSDITFILAFLVLGVLSKQNDEYLKYYLSTLLIIEVWTIIYRGLWKQKEQRRIVSDIAFLVFIFMALWQMGTAIFKLVDPLLYPSPGQIVSLFISEISTLLQGLWSSLKLLAQGYFLALALGVLSALIIGASNRFYAVVSPITKVLGPIPPIVYIPYAIAILPTFKAASVFIIFIGAFWPIFINTLNGTFGVEKKIYDSARALNVSKCTMLFQVILPSALPSIVTGANIGMIMSFILLTSAEMIGATSGLGWYVKYYSDFADYPRVMVGIVFIGIVVTVISFVIEKITNYLLRWRQ